MKYTIEQIKEMLAKQKETFVENQIPPRSFSIIEDLLVEVERLQKQYDHSEQRNKYAHDALKKLQGEVKRLDVENLELNAGLAEFNVMRQALSDSETQLKAAESLAASSKREAEHLATTLWNQFYKDEAPNWKLCDTTAGVITQIDNMVAGICEMLAKAESLAASRLADQESIEKHTARECIGICMCHKSANWAAAEIRKRYGVESCLSE